MKVDLKNRDAQAKPRRIADDASWRLLVGAALARALALAGLSQKEAAALVDRDPAQVARWIAGTERPHFDAIFAAERLRHPMLLAFADLAGAGVDVTTQITIRRSA